MEREGDRVLRYAYVLLKNRQDAEDVVQESFLRLWRHGLRRGMDSLSPALLFHTVTNLCKDRLRYRRRHPEEPADAVSAWPAEPAERFPDEDARIFQAVMQLAFPERQCVVLYYYLDHSVREVAEALGVTPQVVKTRLYRARQHLRPLLGELGAEREGMS
ncbi:MAG: RNA polymerase sigma factor [Firmicutes bacterium]|nr:RNA polymerase sigma factor [Alicyclobacillaceae bacterium]MCL6496891.1 RNA polymerase sigma factor [Bacillota bacterium]